MKDIIYDVGLSEQDNHRIQKQRIARKKQRQRKYDASDRIHTLAKKGRHKNMHYENDDGEMIDLNRIQSFNDLI